jgi:hypothetical protein
MTIGRCNDCGGATHPFAIYEWNGRPLLRNAVCPIHGTPLAQTTYGRRGKLVKLRCGPTRIDRSLLPGATS